MATFLIRLPQGSSVSFSSGLGHCAGGQARLVADKECVGVGNHRIKPSVNRALQPSMFPRATLSKESSPAAPHVEPLGEANAEPAASTCPLSAARSSVSTSASDALKPKSSPLLDQLRDYTREGAEDSFISKKSSNVFDGLDHASIFKALIPIQSLIGIGVLGSSILSFFFPPTVSLALSALLILPPLVSALLRSASLLPDHERQSVRRGGVTDTIEGEFCVFLLGARSNHPLRFTNDYSFVGLKFNEMIAELERLPANAGYLGGDLYNSANPMRGSHGMAVTYWRSYSHLLQYTHDSSLAHVSPMRELGQMKFGDKSDIGIWHEAYVVKDGQHESIYVNCPPLGLGAAAGLRPAKGSLSNSRGRMKASGKAPEPGPVGSETATVQCEQ